MLLFFLSSGLFLGWSLGANDAANIFGSAVGTRMVRFRTAAVVASLFVIIGATFQGSGGADTLSRLGSINELAGAFTVALADEKHMKEADYFGIASGRKTPGKFARAGLSAVKSERVNAPVIEEFPLTMECEFVEEVNSKTLHCYVGKIVNVLAEENVLDEKGKVCPEKLNAILFDNFTGGYYTVGKRVGKAWHAGLPLHKGE